MKKAIIGIAVVFALIGVVFLTGLLSSLSSVFGGMWHPRIFGYGLFLLAVLLLIYGFIAKSPKQ